MLWRGEPIHVPPLPELALEHAYGRQWYAESGANIATFAELRGISPRRVAEVLAILSPRVSVAQNVRLAVSYLDTGKAPGAMGSRLQALARYESTGLFNGDKVQAFAAALLGDPDAAVIDAWMLRLLGVREVSMTRKRYRTYASAVRNVALYLGWPTAETQAALWCGARALVGYRDTYSPLRLPA